MLNNIYVNYLAYFGVGMVLLAIGVATFVLCTKNKEFALIAQGNKAAGIIIAGRTVGLAIVIYSAIANSVSLLDLVIWAAIGIVSQIVADFLAEVLTPNFNIQQALGQDNVAVAIALVGMFIAIGLIIAGCLTY